MSTIEKAISLAIEAHKGKVDKAGAPYILHPLRVMFRMETREEIDAFWKIAKDRTERECEYALNRIRFPDQTV